MRTYQFVFDNPNWLTNLLLATVCQLIPVIGPIVVLGYFFEMIEGLHKSGGRTYPDFDFNRFLAYLTRGVWPFLASLLVAVVLIVLITPFVILMVVSVGQPGPVPAPPVLHPSFFVGLVGVLFVVLVSLPLQVLAFGPIALRAGLTEEIGPAFSPAYIRDFIGRVWREQLLAFLFIFGTAPIVFLGGLIFFCVGVNPAMTLAMFAYYHSQYQLSYT